MTDCNKRMQAAHVVTEDGKQYFVCGNNYIEISEHFAEQGKTLRDLIEDVISIPLTIGQLPEYNWRTAHAGAIIAMKAGIVSVGCF